MWKALHHKIALHVNSNLLCINSVRLGWWWLSGM